MWVGIISLFPDMFRAITDFGVIGQAVRRGLLSIKTWNPRDFSREKGRNTDDRPYGGGPGMLMMVQPLRDAIHSAKQYVSGKAKVIYLSPQGQRISQRSIEEIAVNENLILVCGRYKGIDERIITSEVNEEWSMGDFILTGGEIPAMALIDATARVIPGVLGNHESLTEDSFSNGLLDCPHFTRPEIFDGVEVPQVLRSGNHHLSRMWRLKQSLGRTWLRRPDLLDRLDLNEEQSQLLSEFIGENPEKKS